MIVDRESALTRAREQLDEVTAYLDVVLRALNADMLAPSYAVLVRHCHVVAKSACRGVETVLDDMRPDAGP